MVPSLLLSCETSVSVKKTLIEKKTHEKIIQTVPSRNACFQLLLNYILPFQDRRYYTWRVDLLKTEPYWKGRLFSFLREPHILLRKILSVFYWGETWRWIKWFSYLLQIYFVMFSYLNLTIFIFWFQRKDIHLISWFKNLLIEIRFRFSFCRLRQIRDLTIILETSCYLLLLQVGFKICRRYFCRVVYPSYLF